MMSWLATETHRCGTEGSWSMIFGVEGLAVQRQSAVIMSSKNAQILPICQPQYIFPKLRLTLEIPYDQ